jgi:hypothetical protein
VSHGVYSFCYLFASKLTPAEIPLSMLNSCKGTTDYRVGSRSQGWGADAMRLLYLTWIAVAVAIPTAAMAQFTQSLPICGEASSGLRCVAPAGSAGDAAHQLDISSSRETSSDENSLSSQDRIFNPLSGKGSQPYLAYYAYSELPPREKPADIALNALRVTPEGAPLEEIQRAADVFGLDFTFMKTVAKIESDFDPKQRTGSHIGLFQLSKVVFQKYGSGTITSSRDNAIAAAYEFVTETILFEHDTHRYPTISELYLIHQQGWQGAAEHVSHPERIAWHSMCATDEGREKGDQWCKLAIWGNVPADVKRIWKTVDKLTSAAFVDYWRKRVDTLYSRYSVATLEIGHQPARVSANRPRARMRLVTKTVSGRKRHKLFS